MSGLRIFDDFESIEKEGDAMSGFWYGCGRVSQDFFVREKALTVVRGKGDGG